MKAKTLFLLLAAVVLALSGCKKELIEPPVNDPYIIDIHATPSNVAAGGVTSILCIAVDPEHNTLTYTWSSSSGVLYADTTCSEQTNVGNPIAWQAPTATGTYVIDVTVEDGTGGSADTSISVAVGMYSHLRTLGDGILSQPMGIFVDSITNEILVADAGDGNVWTYDGVDWNSFSYRGEIDTSIDTITVIDTNSVPHETTTVIDTTLDTLGFDMPTDIHVDQAGTVYVLDGGLDRVHIFGHLDFDGYNRSLSSISGTSIYPPTGFVVEGGFIYSACGNKGIRKRELATGLEVDFNQEARQARDICYDGAGGFWVTIVAAPYTFSLKKYDQDLNHVSGSAISDSVFQPWGIAFNPASTNLFVSQWGDDSDTLVGPQCHIAEFTTGNAFVGRWGDTGPGSEQFNSPAGLWITSNKELYICDRGNGVIKVFDIN